MRNIDGVFKKSVAATKEAEDPPRASLQQLVSSSRIFRNVLLYFQGRAHIDEALAGHPRREFCGRATKYVTDSGQGGLRDT